MARSRKRSQKKNKTQQKEDTLKIVQGLRACTVVLRNIALDTDLIQRYQLNLPLKQEKLLEQSHIDTPTPSKKLKGSAQKKNATKNRKRTIKNISKKIVSEKKRQDKKIEPQQTYKVIEVNKDISSHQIDEIPKVILTRLRCYNNVEPFSSKSTDETSSTDSVTHFNYMENMTMLMNKNDKNVRKPSINIRIDSEKIQHLYKSDVKNGKFKLFICTYPQVGKL